MVDITLADHEVAVFKITAVRLYRKDRFPASVVYGNTGYAALRLITCGGSFDEQRHQYLSNIVAFAAGHGELPRYGDFPCCHADNYP